MLYLQIKGHPKVVHKLGEFIQRTFTISVTLKHHALGAVAILEILSTYTLDQTCVSGNGMFHRLFWAYEPCIKGFTFYNLLFKLMERGCTGNIKGALLMALAQDGNNNIFPIALTLVEGWWMDFFSQKNLRLHIAHNLIYA